MSAEEFWKDDPQLFVSYRISFINKENREMEKADYICWLQGAYFNDSNVKTMGIVNQTIHNGFQSFSKNPHFTKEEIPSYVEKPYNEIQKEEKNKENNKNKNYNETLIRQASIKQIYIEKIKKQNGKG